MRRAGFVVITTALLPGCLLVRTSEHLITVREDGTGEAVMRLIDIRSDGRTDSAVNADFDLFIRIAKNDRVPEFEQGGRKITGKRVVLRGDTLMAEVSYTFSSLFALEGVRVSGDEVYVTVGPDREVVKTNGRVGTEQGGTRITWNRDARRLIYQVREQGRRGTTSLTSRYAGYHR